MSGCHSNSLAHPSYPGGSGELWLCGCHKERGREGRGLASRLYPSQTQGAVNGEGGKLPKMGGPGNRRDGFDARGPGNSVTLEWKGLDSTLGRCLPCSLSLSFLSVVWTQERHPPCRGFVEMECEGLGL